MCRRLRLIGNVVLLAIPLLLLLPQSAAGYETGIFGYSGKDGGPICNSCHSSAGGAVVPDVAFQGPSQVAAGTIATFTFVVTSNKPSLQKGAGFDVAASGGTLGIISGQNEIAFADGEISHMAPKTNTNGVAQFAFTWQAPEQLGAYTLYGAGNSVNLDGSDLRGDASKSTTMVVAVVAALASPTPTTTPTPTVTPALATATSTPVPPTATLAPTAPPSATSTQPAAATFTPLPTSTRRPTPPPTPTRTTSATPTPTATPTASASSRGDANCDGAINAADIVGVEKSIVGGEGTCPFADADCDRVIDAGDLDAVIERIFGTATMCVSS